MTTAKEAVRQLLDSLPDDASYEDIQYEIPVRRRVADGLKAAEAGRVLTQAEVDRRIVSRFSQY